MYCQVQVNTKEQLQVEQSARATRQPDAIVIDGCASLWVVHWPSQGSVQDLVTNFVKYVKGKLNVGTRVHVIFDRYCEYSIKSGTRCSRKAQVSRDHQLCLSFPLPPQQVALNVTKKQQQKKLIDMICDEFVSTVELLNLSNSLVVTGKIPIPTEVCNGLQILRPDFKTMHEEADVIIPHQVVYLASLGCCSIKVISDDTDVFVLLVHYYAEKNFTSTMEPASQGHSSANIGSTFAKHRSIAPQLLSAHALSGFDTVASYFGIGKIKVVKVLVEGNRLNHLGNLSANQKDVLYELTPFDAECYGQKYEAC